MLISPPSLLREAAQSFHLAHAMRENGAAGIFIGLMASGAHSIMNGGEASTTAWWFLLSCSRRFTGSITSLGTCHGSVPFTTRYRSVLLVMAVLDRVEVSSNRTRFEKSY